MKCYDFPFDLNAVGVREVNLVRKKKRLNLVIRL